MNKFIAEAVGTFILVFAGTGAIVVNEASGGTITHSGIAITFGLVVTAMIYAVGDVSGAHINPAVTIAFWAAGRFDFAKIIPYISAQLLGAIAASAMLRVLFLENEFLGATLPAGPWWQSFVLEILLTFILMFVILCVTSGAKEKGLLAGVAIGGTVALDAMFGGPICGASMNPARSIGPALVSGHLQHIWIYVVAPIIGALIAIPLHRSIYNTEETTDLAIKPDPREMDLQHLSQ